MLVQIEYRDAMGMVVKKTRTPAYPRSSSPPPKRSD